MWICFLTFWVLTCNCVSHICSRSWYNNYSLYVCHVLQVLGSPWTMWPIPTTVLWPSRILELVVLLWSVPLPTYPAVHLQTKKRSGTFPMEVRSKTLVSHHLAWHSPELGLNRQQQYVSTVTLGLPQQESSAVTYLMPVETCRASMWGYILPPQVGPVHWKAMLLHMLMLHDVIVDLAWVSSTMMCRGQQMLTIGTGME